MRIQRHSVHGRGYRPPDLQYEFDGDGTNPFEMVRGFSVTPHDLPPDKFALVADPPLECPAIPASLRALSLTVIADSYAATTSCVGPDLRIPPSSTQATRSHSLRI